MEKLEDIILLIIKKNGANKMLYPATKAEACLCDNDTKTLDMIIEELRAQKPLCKEFVLSKDGWLEDIYTGKYEYDINDTEIHRDSKIELVFDTASLESLEASIYERHGSQQEGYFALITNEKPETDLSGHMYIEEVRQ